MIDAQRIVFPIVARELNTAILSFTTTTEAARSFLPPEYEVVDGGAGTLEFVVTFFEYRRGDWAPCNSLDIAFAARPAGDPDGEVGIYMCPALVNHPFNSEAAYWSLGISRNVGEILVSYRGGAVTFTATEGDRLALRVRFPRPPAATKALPTVSRAYTSIGGQPYVVPFEMDLPGTKVPLGDVTIEIGEGQVADALRRLGLPRRPNAAAWGEGMTGTFHAAQPLAP